MVRYDNEVGAKTGLDWNERGWYGVGVIVGVWHLCGRVFGGGRR